MRRGEEGDGTREIPKLPGSPGPARSFSLYICREAFSGNESKRCSRADGKNERETKRETKIEEEGGDADKQHSRYRRDPPPICSPGRQTKDDALLLDSRHDSSLLLLVFFLSRRVQRANSGFAPLE